MYSIFARQTDCGCLQSSWGPDERLLIVSPLCLVCSRKSEKTQHDEINEICQSSEVNMRIQRRVKSDDWLLQDWHLHWHLSVMMLTLIRCLRVRLHLSLDDKHARRLMADAMLC